MNTNKLMNWLGGSWRQDLGENPKIALKNEKIAHQEEVESKLEAEFNPNEYGN